MKMLREAGYLVDNVEMYNAYSRQRSDLYGFLDLLAIDKDITLGVQVCSADFSSHVHKLTDEREQMAIKWLECPSRRCILIGWRKVLKKRGGKQKVYKPRLMEFWLNGAGVLRYAEYKGECGLEGCLFGDEQTGNDHTNR